MANGPDLSFIGRSDFSGGLIAGLRARQERGRLALARDELTQRQKELEQRETSERIRRNAAILGELAKSGLKPEILRKQLQAISRDSGDVFKGFNFDDDDFVVEASKQVSDAFSVFEKDGDKKKLFQKLRIISIQNPSNITLREQTKVLQKDIAAAETQQQLRSLRETPSEPIPGTEREGVREERLLPKTAIQRAFEANPILAERFEAAVDIGRTTRDFSEANKILEELSEAKDVDRDTQFREILDPVTGKPTVGLFDKQTGEKIADIGTPILKGLRITTNPDGTFEFEQGSLSDIPGSAKGRAFGKLSEIKSTLGVIQDIKDVISVENVGLSGDFRALVFGARQQAEAFGLISSRLTQDVSLDFTKNPSLPVTRGPKDKKPVSEAFLFDPKLSKLNALTRLLSYKVARALDPSGRLSDFDVENAGRVIGAARKLTGIRDVTARLEAIERLLLRERDINEDVLGLPRTGDQQVTRPREQPSGDFDERFKQLEEQGLSDDEIADQLIKEGFK